MSDTMPRVALALALHGCVPQAEEILYELEAEARDAALVPGDLFTLADALNALAEAGYPDEAVAVVASEPPMLAHLEALVWPDDEFGVDLPLMAGCEVLASVGAFERLEAMVEEAPGHLLILFPLAEALAGTGQIERAQALLASCPDESSGDSVRAAVARGLVLQGDTEAGMEFVRSMADTEKQVGTLSRLARSADSADRHGDAELLLGAAIDLADDTDTPLSWGKTRSLVEALADLGHVKEARSRLATALSGAGADLGVHEFPECARLLAAVGWHEQAETLANGIGDVAIRARTQAEVAEVFAEAAEYDRAERLARRVLPESAAWSAFAAIAAVADEPRARRLVVAALSHVSWTQVLPALLRLDPRVVPLVVRTLSGPVVANSTSATTWKSPIGPKRPIAARTSAPSSK